MASSYAWSRLIRSLSVCAVALGMGLAVTGCANPVEKAIEQVMDKASSPRGGQGSSQEPAAKDQSDSGGRLPVPTAEVPEDFPSFVPLPSRAPLTAVRDTDAPKPAWGLLYLTDDGEAEQEALLSTLKADGFTVEGETAFDGKMHVVVLSNGNYTVSVSLLGSASDRDGQQLQIAVAQLR